MRKFLTLTAAAALAVALGFAGTAQAASISIDNDDFDTQVLGENGATLGVITDWTVSVAGNGGLFNPTADEYSVDHTTIGNVAWSRDGSVISQVLTGETLTAGTKYTLTAKVGFRNDNSPPPFPGYKVQLWAGGTLLVEDDNSTPPAADTFITSTVMYQAFGNDPNLGDTLEIRLQSKSGSGQAHFNDITLDAVGFSILYVDADDGEVDATTPGSPDCDGSGDFAFTTIQAAIDAALTDDTVMVCPRTYTQDLEIFTDGLELVGITGSKPTIVGVDVVPAASFPLADPNIDIQADGVSIHNFNIEHPVVAVDEYASGIVLTGRNIAIFDNDFLVAGGDVSQGIQTWRELNAPLGLRDISGLNIHDNMFSHLAPLPGSLGYEGIFINPQTDDEATDNPVTIANNTFSGELFRGATTQRSYTVIQGNTLTTDQGFLSTFPRGIQASGASIVTNVSIVDNTFNPKGEEGAETFHTCILLTAGVTDSLVAENEPRLCGTYGIHLREGADDNVVRNNSVGQAGEDGILIDGDGNTVNRNSTHHAGDDGIEVTGDDNDFSGNNSHHNTASAYDNNGDGNCFDDTGKDRNKAKFNGNNNIPDNLVGDQASCP